MTLYSVSGSQKWAILLPQDEVENPEVTCDINEYYLSIANVPAVTPNMYYSTGVGINFKTPPAGACNGTFTVNSNGDKVWFSNGNLQYQIGTNTWRFASYQYSYIGNNNKYISSTYQGSIDLFGWGTSGYNHGAVCYQPWSTSQTKSDYYAYGYKYKNLYEQTGQADWGYNAISNGGNTENSGWRTLTKDEWEYVFNTRNTTSGIRYAKANVNGNNGVILLPDNWNSSTYNLSNTNTQNASFSSNTLDDIAWNTLQPTGAVFLPAAGYRDGTTVNYYDKDDEDNVGEYWTSNMNDNSGLDGASAMCFHKNYVYTNNFQQARFVGCSVRLVRDVE